MKLAKPDVATLLSDESFINYCRRSVPEDIDFWEAFAKEKPDQEQLVEYAKEKYFLLFNALAGNDLDEQVSRLRNRLDAMDAPEAAPVFQLQPAESYKRQGKMRWSLKIAAALALLAALFFLVRYFNSGSSKFHKRTFAAAHGERKNIQLPDGTDVTLNAGSKIEIRENFGGASRDVYLEGEAFFDVRHNEKLPFIVHIPVMDVKALGTAFNIKAYPAESITETSLIRGLVEVTLKENNNQTLLLYPNQKVKWSHVAANPGGQSALKGQQELPVKDSLVRSLQVTDWGSIREIAWKDNKLMFDNELLENIAILLERWYGVQIEFETPAIRNYRFTGEFEKEDINTVLDFLKESRQFNYKIIQGEPLKVILSK